MEKGWQIVTKQDIIKAIELFESKKESYPEPRNTFLVINDKKYPAKHIRGLAYLIANQVEISKNEFGGGKETANFFAKHGFTIQYKKDIVVADTDIKKAMAEKKEKVKKPAILKESGIIKHKICRLIVTGKQYDRNNNPNNILLIKLVDKYLAKAYQKKHFEFIVTPGGFLRFYFPSTIKEDVELEVAEEKYVELLKKEAGKTIDNFFAKMSKTIFSKLQETADYFTIGIDGVSDDDYIRTIELVAIFDLKKEKVIHWTGKFYPTESERKKLIKINDLNTHFIELNNQKIAILGCHDLNVYSPRGQATSNPNGWKKQLADSFKTICKKYNPDIILQHPHTTDTPNIWNLAWKTVEKELPAVKHYASGIKYYNHYGVRGTIESVLDKTKKGDVIDFYFD